MEFLLYMPQELIVLPWWMFGVCMLKNTEKLMFKNLCLKTLKKLSAFGWISKMLYISLTIHEMIIVS